MSHIHARRLVRLLPIMVLAVGITVGCRDDDSPVAPVPDTGPRPAVGTTYTVTNTNDAGPGSLRQAIADAGTGGTIVFDPSIAGQTITLATNLQFPIGGDFVVDGGATTGMTVSGGDQTDVFLVLDNANVVLRNLTITHALSFAGALSNQGQLRIENTTMTGNHSIVGPSSHFGNGGAINNDLGSLTLVNSTISGNVAETAGGGIYNFQSAGGNAGDITLINSTVANNTALNVGGIAMSGGTLRLRNSIIADNSSQLYGNCFLGTTTLYEGTSLSNDTSCGNTTGILVMDPQLSPLANNGGPTQTHAFARTSPALDAATDCNVSEDQRHVVRPLGSACDIGAYEFDTFATAVVKIDGSIAVNPLNGVAYVTGTMTCSETAAVPMVVLLRQDQKVGRAPVTVQAGASITVACGGLTYWSVALAPASGGFQNGSASATALPGGLPQWWLAPSVSANVKLFWGHK